jgi:hypothetical protein
MKERQINIGITSSLILILIQLIGGFYELMQFDNKSVVVALNLMNPFFNIIMFIVLWRVLVKYHKQSQLDLLIKSFILILIISAILTIVLEFQIAEIIIISLVRVSVINLILYFVFVNRIMDIEKFEIKQIESLKNYSLAFILCLLGQFALSIVIELKNIELKFINHILFMIPIVFILSFFVKIKNEFKLI